MMKRFLLVGAGVALLGINMGALASGDHNVQVTNLSSSGSGYSLNSIEVNCNSNPITLGDIPENGGSASVSLPGGDCQITQVNVDVMGASTNPQTYPVDTSSPGGYGPNDCKFNDQTTNISIVAKLDANNIAFAYCTVTPSPSTASTAKK